ncbi:CD209 antigen-like protein E [Brienomyrus brachyistius]|uniref:CD209 antigen-like protein E n=1 Tax=Brienomyrus brachyistius TaxID=42636 RepID=UPI0020B22DA4|nr:CD209 antigen-like protein E [Brienomyrus brachyistius]
MGDIYTNVELDDGIYANSTFVDGHERSTSTSKLKPPNSTDKEAFEVIRTQVKELQDSKEKLEVRICPQNWMSFNLSCYYISNETQSWNDSRKKCIEKGADLAIISSRVEQVFIDDFNGRFWIGLTDLHEEGTWKWVDGEVIPKEKGLYPQW